MHFACQVQIVLAGPPDDSCGLYAGELLAGLGDEFKGRLFVCTKPLGFRVGFGLVWFGLIGWWVGFALPFV